ncbi:alternate F1F0 ATPase, F1 subunit alpha [Myxococcota bacterium]|nr:alternate F1F0 ATPase, F1 subunit alpha [Myxococcota bacterium]
MTEPARSLREAILTPAFVGLQTARTGLLLEPTLREIGRVREVQRGVVRVTGLPGARMGEEILFADGSRGMVLRLNPEDIGVALIEESAHLYAGIEVYRSGNLVDVPVGEGVLGRVVDATGVPLDNNGPIRATQRYPLERIAPPIMHRDPVQQPLQTGIKVIDAMFPIGRGQRELILGDRQTGKTAIAVDTILHQHDQGVLCIYCAIGQRSTAVARVIDTLRQHGAMSYTTVVVAGGDAPPGLQYITPYAATSMAEYLMEHGRDVLIVYDDLTRHARAYREISLLLRRPPAREAFPGDIFYIHSRLLERSTRLRKEHGGGSLTALPIVETEAQNLSAYIPTNLISISDGQIYLSPDLFQKGMLPAVEIGRSVSRVGGKTQLPAYRAVVGMLRLTYTQFEELEAFSRFGARLDETNRQILTRGRCIREVLKQDQFDTLPAADQILLLLALTQGLFDALPLARIPEAEQIVRRHARKHLPQIIEQIDRAQKLTPDQIALTTDALRQALQTLDQGPQDGLARRD